MVLPDSTALKRDQRPATRPVTGAVLRPVTPSTVPTTVLTRPADRGNTVDQAGDGADGVQRQTAGDVVEVGVRDLGGGNLGVEFTGRNFPSYGYS